jgi:hypothetical protein
MKLNIGLPLLYIKRSKQYASKNIRLDDLSEIFGKGSFDYKLAGIGAVIFRYLRLCESTEGAFRETTKTALSLTFCIQAPKPPLPQLF